MTRIMGLDISTTTIGIAIIDFNKNGKVTPRYIDYYKPIKGKIEDKEIDSLNMLSEAKKYIQSIIIKYQPTNIGVEDYIRFMKGGSGSATIIPLANLNRTICLSVFEQFPDIPLHICNVMSIRTRIKKSCNLIALPEKKQLPEILEKELKIKIPCPVKDTRKGQKIMDEYYDMTDAISVCFYCYKLLNEKK